MSPITTVVRLEQFAKSESGNVTGQSTVTLVIWSQPENAHAPSVVTFGPSETVRNFTHPLNADEPMLVREPGNSNGSKFRQFKKAESPMLLRFGNDNWSKFAL